MSDDPTIAVSDASERERYEIRVDGELAGFATYKARPRQIAFEHTEIDAGFEGQGLAGKLIAFALDDARERGLAVLPFCPFVKAYVQRHREYADLVPEDRRAEFEL
ncbi:MAG TPA: GNAT family N-acetyltransferase [Solirubrobacterales bacterium]|nr:GNAT family N-acetyltransferase [Solirubrobacterales bacterium]